MKFDKYLKVCFFEKYKINLKILIQLKLSFKVQNDLINNYNSTIPHEE